VHETLSRVTLVETLIHLGARRRICRLISGQLVRKILRMKYLWVAFDHEPSAAGSGV
jgi:hypothetical protein